MNSGEDETRLKVLGERIQAAKAAQNPGGNAGGGEGSQEHYSTAQIAWRMVTELVAGLGIGVVAGYGLDVILGTTPWLMVLFTGLGFAAGVKTMMRSAREVEEKQRAAQSERAVGEEKE